MRLAAVDFVEAPTRCAPVTVPDLSDRGFIGRAARMAAILHQRDVALEQWRNFNEVYGYGQPSGVAHWPVLSVERINQDWRRLKPKPTPLQYRLKRRSAGSKRRQRAK